MPDVTEETSGLPAVAFGDDSGVPSPSSNPTQAGPTKIDLSKSTGDALDDLFKQQGGDPDAPVLTDEEKAIKDKEAAAATAEDESSDLDVKADKEREREQKEKDDAKAKAEAAEKAAAVAKTEPEDPFKKHQLPPHASVKASESFEAVKRAAREQISALTKELQDAKKAVEASAPGKLPEPVEAELKELREFRRAHDFANDSEFKAKYVAPISAADEAIFAKLKQNGYSDDKIAKIKEIGVATLDWEPVLASLPTVARNLVSAKLMEREGLLTNRDEALKTAPNQEEYAKKQAEKTSQKASEESALIETIINRVLDGEDESTKKPFRDAVLNKREVPANATEDQKKEVAAHNEFVDTQGKRFKAIMADRSPRMFATLAASTLLAYRFKAEAEALRPEVLALREKLAKIRKSSSTASAAKGAPGVGEVKPSAKPLVQRGEDALDALKAELDRASP